MTHKQRFSLKSIAHKGNPVANATVTLSCSDNSAGPFVVVPNEDAIMSPTHRTNPDTTNNAGLFGWDVIAGYYKVCAEKQGYKAPAPNAAQSFVEITCIDHSTCSD